MTLLSDAPVVSPPRPVVGADLGIAGPSRISTPPDRRSGLTATPAQPIPRPVRVLTAAGALAATVWSYRTHSMTLYGDARAHLDVARHVIDGLRPGLAQLGSVWLPVPHLLLIPFVAVGAWWHDGIAGAVVGGVCYYYAATRFYGLVQSTTGSSRAAWIGFAVLATNLNFLYLQSTALTEPVLLAFLIGSVRHLERWMHTWSMWDLAKSATAGMLATLTRYDGWFYIAVATVVVLWWSRTMERRKGGTQANLVVYLFIGLFGIALWLLYNLTIFGDAFYFVHSSFSAQSQQASLSHAGMLATKGHLGRSGLTYGWTVVDVLGPLVALAAVPAAVLLLTRRPPNRTSTRAVTVLLAAPVAFNVLSLWTGQSTVRVPQVAPFGMWNDRYGLMALPFAAFVLGAAASTTRWRPVCVTLVVAASVAIMAASTPITIQDGRTGTSSATGGHPELAASYLHTHYRGGEILADDASAEPLMFASRLDLHQFVTIGFHPWFEEAIQSPASTVRWVVAYDGDQIATDMVDHPDRFADFSLVLRDGSVSLYLREPGPPGDSPAASA